MIRDDPLCLIGDSTRLLLRGDTFALNYALSDLVVTVSQLRTPFSKLLFSKSLMNSSNATSEDPASLMASNAISAATSSASTQNMSSRSASTAGSERRNSRSTGLASRSVSRLRLTWCAPGSGLAGAGRMRNVTEGLPAARRAIASADMASLLGGSITATMTPRPRRRRCLASSTMGFRWPTPSDGNSTKVFVVMARCCSELPIKRDVKKTETNALKSDSHKYI
uniref:Uncharacterized protein n=1 Tax=Oryza rufipogon TaxID=4529 RepID=A0A0E0PQ77_ORYRU